MKAVSKFEHNLLRILHFFLGRVPWEQARPLIANRWEKEKPNCLSRECIDLIKDSLGKGSVELLARGLRRVSARSGGWRRERFLRGEAVVEGRLWERTPPEQLGLSFSPQTIEFLTWITAVRPAEDKTAWSPKDSELTLGDLLLLHYAYHHLRETEVGPALRSRAPFTRHALCRLAYPEDFYHNEGSPEPNFKPWTNGVGACILEALQGDLAERWSEAERSKTVLTDWQEMRALGQYQEQVLKAFLDAVSAANRLDLARFLLQALGSILVEGISARYWIQRLATTGPRMADRTETHQAALAVVRQMNRFRQWEREARVVRFFDEGYQQSQLYLSDWERLGCDALYQHAQRVIQQLDPMKQVGTGSQPAAESGNPPRPTT